MNWRLDAPRHLATHQIGLTSMTQTLPHTFATASGLVPASWLDDNFQFLLSLIEQGSSAPSISYSPPVLTAPVASGAAAGTASIFGMSDGFWSLSPTTDFQINSALGTVTASTTVTAGTYPFTISYTGTVSGQTITVSVNTGIVVNGSSVDSSDFFYPTGSNLADVAATF